MLFRHYNLLALKTRQIRPLAVAADQMLDNSLLHWLIRNGK
jgi:hypothetical protein